MLLAIILDNIETFTEDNASVDLSVPSSVTLKQIKARVGHARFSTNVKNNYNNRCCFPECRISDSDFLVASYIARWADNREKRGDTSNALCLCPIHDKHLNWAISHWMTTSEYVLRREMTIAKYLRNISHDI